MLLANMAVAHKVHRAFPERALLRRHPPPQTKMLNDLVEFCDQMGLPMDFSSAGALNVSAGQWGGGRGALPVGHAPLLGPTQGGRSRLSCGEEWTQWLSTWSRGCLKPGNVSYGRWFEAPPAWS